MTGISWIHYVKKDYSLESTATRKNLLRGLYQGEVLENSKRWAVRLFHEAITDGLGPLATWDTSEALCKKEDMELFIGSGSRALAKKVCERCPIKEECLEMAIKCDISHGIWGGTTPTERGHRRAGTSRYANTAVEDTEQEQEEIIFIVETENKQKKKNVNYLNIKLHTPLISV
jgi:WhiB family redox-sensing transcriptional regulator